MYKRAFTRPRMWAIASLTMATTMSASTFAADLTVGNLEPGVGSGKTFESGDLTTTVKGTFNVGTLIRAQNADPALIAKTNGGTATGAPTVDDGDLNYGKNKPVSTAASAFIESDTRYRGAGLALSVYAWYDYTQLHGDVPHGNSANGYAPNSPLNDRGFAERAKFSGITLADAYLYGKADLGGDQSLLMRIGNQVIPWTTPTTINGGIEQVNPTNIPARGRAGVTPEEVRVQTPSLYMKWSATKKLSFDAFYQFFFQPNVLAGCGTFVSLSDYAAPGCTGLTLGGVLTGAPKSDQQGWPYSVDHALRQPDQKPDSGQFGFSTNYMIDKVGLVGLYYADYTNRAPSSNIERTGDGPFPTTPYPPAPGAALNAQYAMAYAAHVRMWGLNFKTRLPDNTGIYAEYTYRPNQPININAPDSLAGELSGKGPLHALQLSHAGDSFNAYDRFKVMQLNLGVGHPFGHVAGGDLKLSGEIGIKNVMDLPDTYSGRRYGRADVFGAAASQQTPTCTGNAAQCAVDGFVTAYSWGYRLRLEDKFTNVLSDLDLTPSLTWAQDVKGYSYDQVFSEGRKIAILALAGTFRKTYTFNVSYNDISGGTYNVLRDRSFYGATVGLKF